jgi:anti-sigma regulatory factor (Ser/Thr protein kinase)
MINDRPRPPWSRLTILNDVRCLPLALGFARDFSLFSGIGEAARNRLELAVEEAVTNVIEHAFGSDEMQPFDIVCRAVPGGVEVAVQDKGLPFDPSQVEEWQPQTLEEAASGHGLGALLMRKLVDEFGYANRGAEGKEIRLVVHADETPVGIEGGAEGAPGDGLEEVSGEAPAADAPRPGVTLRWMQGAEAVEVARCVYDSYGYSYANENVYYPERLAGMNEQGTLRSAVAVTSEGEVAGHAALLIDRKWGWWQPRSGSEAQARPPSSSRSWTRRGGDRRIRGCRSSRCACTPTPRPSPARWASPPVASSSPTRPRPSRSKASRSNSPSGTPT